ncbi:NFX1-type zinc finger-containing protein 1-like isoform X2 [Lytechinus pictus]|uniref:NFX1-type zinc finger-containing protein 1-like isoform X2 n=1 Tax=Lytechinus pictus TaxID=7653 RepID=UPI0030BA12C1
MSSPDEAAYQSGGRGNRGRGRGGYRGKGGRGGGRGGRGPDNQQDGSEGGDGSDSSGQRRGRGNRGRGDRGRGDRGGDSGRGYRGRGGRGGDRGRGERGGHRGNQGQQGHEGDSGDKGGNNRGRGGHRGRGKERGGHQGPQGKPTDYSAGGDSIASDSRQDTEYIPALMNPSAGCIPGQTQRGGPPMSYPFPPPPPRSPFGNPPLNQYGPRGPPGGFVPLGPVPPPQMRYQMAPPPQGFQGGRPPGVPQQGHFMNPQQPPPRMQNANAQQRKQVPMGVVPPVQQQQQQQQHQQQHQQYQQQGQRKDYRKDRGRGQRSRGRQRGGPRRRRDTSDQGSVVDECESLVGSDDDDCGSIMGDDFFDEDEATEMLDDLKITPDEANSLAKYPDLQLMLIKEWMIKKPSDSMAKLLENKGSLQKLLHEREISNEMLNCLISLLTKVFQEQGDGVQEIAKAIISQSKFLKLHIPQYIMRIRINIEGETTEKLLQQTVDLTTILKQIVHCMTRKQASEILPPLVLIGDVHRDMESRNIPVIESAKEALKECFKKQKDLSESPANGVSKNAVKKERSKDALLTEFPSSGEIKEGSPPDLSAPAETGKYKNTEAIIATQFQLLRELIAQPIRENVSKYYRIREGKKKLTDEHLHEIPVYQYVNVKGISSKADLGLVYLMQFEAKYFQRDHWDSNIHLAEGSVVCMSVDHFNTLIYGIVHERQSSVLQEGFVDLYMPRAEDVALLLTSYNFLMIDCKQTIEGVLDVLSTLRHITDVTMPMQQHFIDMSHSAKQAIFCEGDQICSYDLDSLVSDDALNRSAKAQAMNVPLTDFDHWPSNDSVLLDGNQYDAVKSALTQELSVITGGPATGKTNVGQAIIRVLLQNRHKWGVNLADRTLGRTDVDSGPILVLAPDKVTLDHFLKGVESKGTVSLDQQNEAKKRASTIRSSGPGGAELEGFQKRISNIQANIISSRKSIINVGSLKQVMSASHADSISQKGGMGVWLMPDSSQKAPNPASVGLGSFDIGDEWVEDPFHIDYDPSKKASEPAEHELSEKDLRLRIRLTERMKKQQEEAVQDPWALQNDHRWRLYRFWLREFWNTADRRLRLISKEIENVVQQHRVKSEKSDFVIYQNASILGVTSSCAITHHRILRYVQPRIIMILQAADVMEAVVIASLSQNCRQLIMIGENKSILEQNAAIAALARTGGVMLSSFCRFIEGKYATSRLTRQHRMAPAISRFIKLDNKELEDHPQVTRLDEVQGIPRRVYLMNHGLPRFNASTHEFEFLSKLCVYLLKQGHLESEISILSTSVGLRDRFRKIKELSKVSSELVDDFLGDNDIILLATFQMDEPGRLKTKDRLIKALSVAKKGFYAVGNFDLLRTQCDQVLQDAERLEALGKQLPLTCRYHENQHDVATKAADIQKRIDTGGCSRECMARLLCGHSCKQPCHKHNNKNLGDYRCEQQCQKSICPAGHKCTKKCFEKCDKKCNKTSERTLQCGHKQVTECSLAISKIKCRSPCEKMLPCGHPCRNACGEPCASLCLEMVEREWPCNHTVKVRCSDTEETCPSPCLEELKCGHRCRGTCGSCMRGRLHICCEEPCGRILVCGHQCKSRCSTACPPCTEKCRNKCKHSRCTDPCGEPCIPCQEHCEWQCPHQVCRRACCQPCDREPCKQPCKKELPCGHECIGLCGEPCPKKCRVCHHDEVTELFFGNEDEPDARFVELEDCGHVIEVQGLDRWMMSSGDETDSETVKLKGCPRCNTPIRKNLRYGNVIKRTLEDIEAVKKKMMGSNTEIKEKKRLLKKKIGLLEKIEVNGLSEEVIRNFRENINECHHLQTLVSRLNRCNFIQEVINMQSQLDGLRQLLDGSTETKMHKSHQDIIKYRCEPLAERLGKMKGGLSSGDLGRFAEQQMNDTLTEVVRLIMECDAAGLLVYNFKWWDKNPSHQGLLIEFDSLLSNQKPLTPDRENEIKGILTRINMVLGHSQNTALAISDRERLQVVHAVGLSQGHWFKCKEGHVYAIGECGGAMEHARCPECGSVIGGQRHRLTDTNDLAGEMDRAQHAAWSKGGQQ